MIEFTEEELLKKIEEEEISILAFAITPWHALGVEACIYNIMQEESTLKGYVLIIDHPITGRALTEENFRYSQSLGIQVAVLKSGSTKRTIFEKIKNPITWIDKYTNSSSVQNAPQEQENTSYLTNSMNSNDLDGLGDLL